MGSGPSKQANNPNARQVNSRGNGQRGGRAVNPPTQTLPVTIPSTQGPPPVPMTTVAAAPDTLASANARGRILSANPQDPRLYFSWLPLDVRRELASWTNSDQVLRGHLDGLRSQFANASTPPVGSPGEGQEERVRGMREVLLSLQELHNSGAVYNPSIQTEVANTHNSYLYPYSQAVETLSPLARGEYGSDVAELKTGINTPPGSAQDPGGPSGGSGGGSQGSGPPPDAGASGGGVSA